MRARCGRCQTDFQVDGPGRYACPACGAVNEVRTAPPGAGQPPPGAGQPPPGPGQAGMGFTPPPPPPDTPSPKTTCPACSFSFIVGDIEVAECPMCGEEVAIA